MMNFTTKLTPRNQPGKIQPDSQLPRRVTWHTAQLFSDVYAVRRGKYRDAIIVGHSSARARVQFCDTGNCALRDYGELYHRNVKKNGADRPRELEPA